MLKKIEVEQLFYTVIHVNIYLNTQKKLLLMKYRQILNCKTGPSLDFGEIYIWHSVLHQPNTLLGYINNQYLNKGKVNKCSDFDQSQFLQRTSFFSGYIKYKKILERSFLLICLLALKKKMRFRNCFVLLLPMSAVML